MTIDLSYPPAVSAITDKTNAFIREVVLRVEDKHGGDILAAGGDARRADLQDAAKNAGIFAPHAPTEYGGLGLNMSDRAPVFEAGGYSLFGPTALNIAAPDEGNVHLLAHIADDEQRAQFLAPLARGDVRSAFAMTEPAPGAGSDPAALTTCADKVPGGWKINGHKYFITGADGAGFFIIFARTSGQPGDRGGATMFLAPADAPGLKIGRHIDTLDRSTIGGHCELFFNDLFVPDSSVLGEPHQGFAYVKVRLGPARMTHVMRWLGAARRGHDVAVEHVAQRDGFGSKLGDLGMIQQMIADNEIDIAATRTLLTQACWELDQGRPGERRNVDRQNLCRRSYLSNSRPISADVWRPWSFRRSAGRPTVARGAGLPHLRRRLRGTPLGHRQTCRCPGAESHKDDQCLIVCSRSNLPNNRSHRMFHRSEGVTMTQAILVAYAQPVSDEREPEFNHWYDEVHIPQVVERIPGIVGGSRYKFADIQLVPTAPAPDRSYLAVYQLDTDDLAATVERLGAALSDGTLDKTDTVSMTVAAPVLHFYSALNDRVAR